MNPNHHHPLFQITSELYTNGGSIHLIVYECLQLKIIETSGCYLQGARRRREEARERWSTSGFLLPQIAPSSKQKLELKDVFHGREEEREGLWFWKMVLKKKWEKGSWVGEVRLALPSEGRTERERERERIKGQ